MRAKIQELKKRLSHHRVIPLWVSLAIRGILFLFGVRLPTDGPLGEGVDAFFIAIVWVAGLLFMQIPAIRSMLTMGQSLRRIERLARSYGRKEIVDFVRGDLEKTAEALAGVLGHEGTYMEKPDLEHFATTCFAAGKGIYNGVESHPPSEFFKFYENYLNAHSLNLANNPGEVSYRVLLATRTALREDSQKNPELFNKFYEWHQHPQVKLVHVYPMVAQQLKDKLGLTTTDIGIWKNQYALLFRRLKPNDTGVVLSMIPKHDPAFDRCEQYVSSLISIACEVSNPPELVDRQLAECWEEYVNVDKRCNALKPFFDKVLGPYERDEILDAAAGIGAESVYLKNRGFNVRPNELEKNFRDIAEKYAKRHGCRLVFDKYNWLELGTAYEDDRFGVVLVLGNSLCLLLDQEERKKAIRHFSRVLRHGGMLIVDERNFEHILRNKNHILDNPPKNYPFGQAMYYGKTVRGCPIEITPEKITWVCYRNDINMPDWETLHQNIVGEFELYPFKERELYDLLRDVGGFKNIQRYSNLKLEDNPEPEFFTYTAVKP